MNITYRIDKDILYIAIEGRIDASNAAEAEDIIWFVNGEETSPAGDGYFTFTETSTVRAEVYWGDGSTDILEKTITVNRHR